MTDAQVLRRAALVLRRASRRPNGLAVRVICRLLADTAERLEVEELNHAMRQR